MPVLFAARAEACAPDDVERQLDRQVDSVRFRGVSSYGVHAPGLVLRLNFVAAVAAECLVSEHVAADTASAWLEAR